MCILMPCMKQVTDEQMAQMFFQNIWVHFGLPKSIISDWDSRFVGSFWSSLWALMDTKLKKEHNFSSANRWLDRSGKSNSGASSLCLLKQAS
jgi:hypothetical protein